ncbi:MAG: hypothetical protein E5V46_03490, partial [Mesorhizobium sp.]
MDDITKLPAEPAAIELTHQPDLAEGADLLLSRETNDVSVPPPPRLHESDPVAFVTDFLRLHRIRILYDGAIAQLGSEPKPATPETVKQTLAKEDETIADLTDRMVLFAQKEHYSFKRSAISTACRQVVKREKGARREAVLGPLIERKLRDVEIVAARSQWSDVASLFAMDSNLSVAILQHFVWQVKTKALRLPMQHHLMPIVWGADQGSGKTTFVKALVAQLEELASFAFLSDIADTRAGQIFSFPVVVVDDMQALEPRAVPILKSWLTADIATNRRLGTSSTARHRVLSSFIGTANTQIQHLVRDETGNRRFAMMPFRNGSVEKGGSERVWETVKALDYELLWRSVSPFEPSPIRVFLTQLYRHQGRFIPESPILSWLKRLDVNSPEVRAISHKSGVMAGELHELYMKQTRQEPSPQAFSNDILKNADNPDVPFSGRQKLKTGYVYIFKRRAAGVLPAAAPPSSP